MNTLGENRISRRSFVGQESYPFPPLVSVEKSLANLRRLLAERNNR
jgi:hypothetical protein